MEELKGIEDANVLATSDYADTVSASLYITFRRGYNSRKRSASRKIHHNQ